MVDPTLRYIFLFSCGFSPPLSFFPPPFRLFSHCVVHPFLCGFPHSCFEQARGFWRPLLFFPACYLLCPHPSSLLHRVVFYQSLCVFPALLVLPPFLVFVLTFLVSPINCSFLLLHSFCFVGPFGSPPSLSVSLPPSPFWSSSPSHLAHPLRFLPMRFSPSSRVFSSLAVSLSVFRSRSLSLSEKQVDKKMMLTCLSESPINGTGFLFVWHNSSQSG